MQSPFCSNCYNQTTEESSGGTFTLNGLGTEMYGHRKQCPLCGSFEQTKWFVVLFIPVLPLGKYRVINVKGKWYDGRRWLSRKLISDNRAR